MRLVGDELEFAISQYLDGGLSGQDGAALEELLATDAAARELLREYQQVHATLRSAPKVPALDWDALLRETAQKCAANSSPAVTNPSVSRRFPYLFPARSQGLHSARQGWFAPVALAASLLIAVGGVALIVSRSQKTITSPPVVADVRGPQVEHSNGPVLAEVSIGAAPAVASNTYRSIDDVIDRPSIVLIDRADNPSPDSDSLY